MKLCERKKREAGSALLVVLGFLSFMVISAVAFAIYMRTERVPSSALRRNTATRHLVKAALAQAMSRVDDAIRNDPFPGLANTNGNNFANFYHDFDNNSMDLWFGRVFMPPNPAGLVNDSGSYLNGVNEPGNADFAWRFAPVTETVSVLNLEALGYLPPSLVNDVRFLSRSSWAAKWQNFAFDAGRFAFCAVNVSDYLDINRTRVGVRSSPLDSCISLLGTSLWVPQGQSSPPVNDALVEKLSLLLGPEAQRQTYTNPDKNKGSAAQATTEYVSMLDYNLAFGANSGGISILSPLFYDWIDNNNNSGTRKYFYGGTVKTAENAVRARRQPFVTDSFAAESNTTYEIDFATLDGQPFSDLKGLMNGKATAQQVAMATSSKCVQHMYNKGLIGEADVFTLYDYLDHDDIPLSLAMPSVECVPMVTAVELVGQNLAKLQLDPPAPAATTYNPNAPGPTTQTKTTTYTLNASSFDSRGVGVRVLVAFPFRHFKGRNIADFNVQVAMRVFVAAGSGSVSVRLANDLAQLRPDPQNNGAAWNQPSSSFTVGGTSDALVWSLNSNKVKVSIPNECDDQASAVMKVDVTSWNGSATVSPNQPFFTMIENTPGTLSTTLSFTSGGSPSRSVEFNLRPYDNTGKLMQQGQIPIAAGASPAFMTDPFKTYAMLWVRITDSAGNETYDLAPAVIDDDMLNGKNNNNSIFTSIKGSQNPGGLLFGGNSAVAYTYANIVAATPVLTGLQGEDRNWQPKALAVVDPRYNYLPEDWFTWNQSNIDGSQWLDTIAKAGYFDVANARDPDIFMFTSNQGYLQSIGEFAFLPRLSEWNAQPVSRISSLLQMGGNATQHASQPQDILNKVCAWRTYPIIRELDDTHHHTLYDDFAKIGIGRSFAGVQAVNPYSDDEAVLMSVFANTPCDYWTTGRIVAGAGSRGETLASDFKAIVNVMGDQNKTSGDDIGKMSDCLEYSFCEKNNSSEMKAEHVTTIMRHFMEAMRADGGRNSWKKIYDILFDNALADLDGGNNYEVTDSKAERFMGANLGGNCPLYSIDRKFLYSYWRDCFANNQQLFLIFVRAESTALGGPGEGTPSQQGGRAVALVWREPDAYDDGDNPSGTYSDKRASTQQRQRFYQGRRPHRMRVLFYHQFD